MVNKPLLSAEMVAGRLYMALCCTLAAGDAAAAATVRLQELGFLATGH